MSPKLVKGGWLFTVVINGVFNRLVFGGTRQEAIEAFWEYVGG